MKQLATIALLLLLVFNFVGYKLVFYAAEQQAGETIVSRIDNSEFNDADLITISVPLSMPYINDSKDFERKDGEITIDGKIYHYVKQKISEGNLVLMCLPDEQKMHIQSAKDEFFKLANQLQNNPGSSKKPVGNTQVLKLVTSDYDKLQTISFNTFSGPVSNTFLQHTSSYALLKGEGITPEQPPEA